RNSAENNMLNVIATETAANTAAAIAGATGNASKDTGNDNSWDIGGGCEGSREQCAVRDPSRDGTRGAGHVLNSDNTDENKQPNLGKDVASATDKDKAELGGAGAGTPGGWEPQDEENGRAKQIQSSNFDDKFKKEDLISSANQPINNQGLSAAARAWEKHAGRPGGVFDPLKGNTVQKNEVAGNFVNEVLNNNETVRTDLSRGGVEYRLPDGRGVRYNSDGSFSGFLDPKR
ncbi:hypothetical protein DFX62_24630, partial [Escherichia coli]|nr:hypothetical protein [Escherichia coli]